MSKFDYIEYFKNIMAWTMQERDMLNHAINNIDKLDLQKHFEAMHEVEKTADDLRKDMIRNLLKDFIPMFEREDIMELAKLLESIIDSIENIFKIIRIYRIRRFDKVIYELLDCLNKEVDAVARVIDELENFKNREIIIELINEAMEMESYADSVYMSGMTELFREDEANVLDILSKKELMQSFEDAINSCEKAAYFIEIVQINNL